MVAKGILATLDWDESRTLEGISVPTTMIVGKEDRLTVPEASRYMARTVADGTLSEITPAGHSGIVEEGDAYAAAIAAGATRGFNAGGKLATSGLRHDSVVQPGSAPPARAMVIVVASCRPTHCAWVELAFQKQLPRLGQRTAHVGMQPALRPRGVAADHPADAVSAVGPAGIVEHWVEAEPGRVMQRAAFCSSAAM